MLTNLKNKNIHSLDKQKKTIFTNFDNQNEKKKKKKKKKKKLLWLKPKSDGQQQ